MKALINNIINFSNVDGPGNRTAIFFQGCPFKCLYCHNPETINRCISCGICLKSCPSNALSIKTGKISWDIKKCVKCDTCIKICPNMSSPKTSLMDVEDLMAIIRRNKPFINGITVSGGESMMQADFLLELFKKTKELGLTNFIDSNGYYDFTEFNELLEYTDYVMLDVKAWDNEFHKRLTGKENDTVLRNLYYLLEKNKLYEVRTVLLNGMDDKNLETIINVSRIINDKCRYKLIAYRKYGVRKEGLDSLGDFNYSSESLEKMKEEALKYTNNVVTT